MTGNASHINISFILTPSVSGMMLGGGCGRELAHWIIHGRPEKDMYGYDIRYITPQNLLKILQIITLAKGSRNCSFNEDCDF